MNSTHSFCILYAYGVKNMTTEFGVEKAIKEKVRSKFSLFDITFSYYCHLGCAHCMYNCTPKHQKSIICRNKIFKYIDEAITFDRFSSFSFGDQEIFYNLELFIEAAQYLQRKKPSTPLTITTSSYWVKNYDHALEQFSLLKKIGLRSVLLSIDDFHQRSVNINNVIFSIKACISVGLDLTLQTIISKLSRRKKDYQRIIAKHLENYCDISKIEWVEHFYTPVGRAKQIPKDELIFESKKLIGGCSVMEVIQINPEGDIIPCCGSGAGAKYLALGNINENGLKEIINNAEINPLFNSLFVWLGPYGLMKELSSAERKKYLSGKHTGVCHACYEIFSNKELVTLLKNRIENNKLNLLAARWHIEQSYNKQANN